MFIRDILIIITAIITSLMAGFFYAWSCSVILGLARVSDATYIKVMQSINSAIQNPIFFTGFFGTPVLLPITAFLHYEHSESFRFWLLLSATVIYLVGVFGVTVFGNVPLNQALDNFNLESASPKEVIARRVQFERPWNKLNTVRTIASIVTLVLVITTCFFSS